MLELKHISRSFHGVQALRDISLTFNGGEVHAVCGENGAGKSTLMNIIGGNIQPDSGELRWNGIALDFQDIATAQQLGISIVYQEGSLSDSLSVAENIFPYQPPRNNLGLIDFTRLYEQTRNLLSRLNIKDLHPKTAVSKLSAEQKKLVEIAKAISLSPSLLILDEPTASISSTKAETIFNLIRSLKAQGTAVIYISHRMDEIMRIADKISVLKDGVYQGTVQPAHATIEQVIHMMVGRDLQKHEHAGLTSGTKTLLEVKHLSGWEFFDISFDVKAGEIFGLAGLQGSGRTALARTIFGDLKPTGGDMFLDNERLTFANPADAMGRGIAYVPEERKSLGLFMERSIAENIGVTNMQHTWFRRRRLLHQAASAVTQLGVKTSSIIQPVKKLSGGNQQKVVIAKWLARKPSLLIVNEPTHGVDIGAKTEIYRLLQNFVQAGSSILLISSDLPELLLLCDRTGVMYQGELRKIFRRHEATEQSITRVASGL